MPILCIDLGIFQFWIFGNNKANISEKVQQFNYSVSLLMTISFIFIIMNKINFLLSSLNILDVGLDDSNHQRWPPTLIRPKLCLN